MGKKTILEQIVNGLLAGGFLSLFTFTGLSCIESLEVDKHLVDGNQIAAKRSYERKDAYLLMGIAGGLIPTAGALLLHGYDMRRVKE